jgi:hypothetical protein
MKRMTPMAIGRNAGRISTLSNWLLAQSGTLALKDINMNIPKIPTTMKINPMTTVPEFLNQPTLSHCDPRVIITFSHAKFKVFQVGKHAAEVKRTMLAKGISSLKIHLQLLKPERNRRNS